ncbi:hypothetical protein BACCIP111895_02520 [Neobacillus rhizosphaerae]|uniref:Uncharacterized protein n=1 Tax=Neobacillus rhizosphaerae TaxID=2880965 RepID=A0ABN8KP30_9BACI|nr:hypothetical protein BACCIP111895_02520 [Neobacillus rhizosphaerae]
MKVYFVLTLLIISTIPLLNLFFLHVFKSVYRPKIMFIIHLSTFLIPLMLFRFSREYAFKFFLCDALILLFLYISNKLYCSLFNTILGRIVYEIFESPVISEIYLVKNRLYSRTLEGYVLIDMKNETYKTYPDVDSCAANDKTVFKRLVLTKRI